MFLYVHVVLIVQMFDYIVLQFWIVDIFATYCISKFIFSVPFSAEQSIILSNFDVLTASGLGERGEQDFALVKETCHALLRVAVAKPKLEASTSPNR